MVVGTLFPSGIVGAYHLKLFIGFFKEDFDDLLLLFLVGIIQTGIVFGLLFGASLSPFRAGNRFTCLTSRRHQRVQTDVGLFHHAQGALRMTTAMLQPFNEILNAAEHFGNVIQGRLLGYLLQLQHVAANVVVDRFQQLHGLGDL